MGGWAVYIATTSGPSRIQDISVDHQLSHAVMTVNFRTKRAAVTNAYADFVSSDAGLIARRVGEHRFRMKVSHDVQRGDSWQLAAFAAHALKAAGRLHSCRAPHHEDVRADLDGAEGGVWATGILGDDLGVLPVEKIKTKLETSWPLFEACNAANLPVICFLPAANETELPGSSDLAEFIRLTEETFPLIQFRYVDQVKFAAEFWLPEEAARPIGLSGPSDTDGKPFWVRYLGPALLVAGGLALLAMIYGIFKKPNPMGPEDEVPQITHVTQGEPDASTVEVEPPVSAPVSNAGSGPMDAGIEALYQIVPGGNCFDPNVTKREDKTVEVGFIWEKVTLIHLGRADLCRVQVKRGDKSSKTIHVEHTGLFGAHSKSLEPDVVMPILVGGGNDTDGLCIAVSSDKTAVGLCNTVRDGGDLKPNEAAIMFDWK